MVEDGNSKADMKLNGRSYLRKWTKAIINEMENVYEIISINFI